MRYFLSGWLALVVFLGPALAQASDSVFRDYQSYAAFVDEHIMNREFTDLVKRLGGRDEYTPEQLAANQLQMENVWPFDFDNVSVFREIDLGGGLRQEGRVYWNGKSYAFYYALLHQQSDRLVVITFALNSSSKEVLSRF